jgi:hypothetical protein
MTARDFQQQITALFRRSPLVPAVLETSGGRVVVDMPEQLETSASVVTVRRRTDPVVHRIEYEAIDRVAALDELPGEGGLSYAEFYAAVRPLLWKEPFQLFTLEVLDGTQLIIDRPGRLSLAGRFGTFLPPGPNPLVRFTYDQVAKVLPSDQRASRLPARRETFLEALQRMSRVTPFLPFTVELVNGIRIVSRHPEAIRMEGDLAVYTEPDGTAQLFDTSSVVRFVSQAIPPGTE